MNLRELVVSAATVTAAFLSVGALKAALFDQRAAGASASQAPASRATAVPRVTPAPTAVAERLAPLTVMAFGGADTSAASRRPLAVMIDNSADASPQAGLDRADVVIEALVEGGITRFMAVFQSREAEAIEPVRSARTPFLHWALEYDAILAHVGSAEAPGDADAGQQIEDWKVDDLDMESGARPSPAAFSRDPAREAPHNVLTSTIDLRKAGDERGYARALRLGLWRYSSAPIDGPLTIARAFTVSFGRLSTFTARWEWDDVSGTYLRWQFGAPQVDGRSGRAVSATNVVIQYAVNRVADENGHVLIDNIGQGRAQIFMAGRAVEATWRKANDAARTRFYGPDGVEIAFRPGPTWIEVVDPSGGALLQ